MRCGLGVWARERGGAQSSDNVAGMDSELSVTTTEKV